MSLCNAGTKATSQERGIDDKTGGRRASHRNKMSVNESATRVVYALLESPVETDPDIETEPTTAPVEPAIPAEPEPDEKPNPFRRREIRPGQEPRPKAVTSPARNAIDQMVDGLG